MQAVRGSPRLLQGQRLSKDSLCRCHPVVRGVRPPRSSRCAARKDDDEPSGLMQVTNTIQSAVNSIADLVPESVPRPAARTGVAIVGGLVLFGLVKQVLSGLFTLVLLGGLGYWWLTKSGGVGDDDDDFKSSSRKSTRQSPNDDDDPLSESRRIMDKYK